IISIIFIILNFKLNKFSIKFKNIFDNFKLGINNFVTTMAITLYTISNSFILGIVTNNTIVGYYTFSENFINVLKSLTSPIIQSLYPNMSKKMHENEIDGIKSINKITPFLLLGNVIIFIMVFIFSNFITLFFGDKYKESINILRILALTPIFVCLSSSFAVLGLMNLKKSGIVARIAVIGGVIGIISTIILTILYKHYGTAISAVLAEVVISGLGFYYFRKYEKKIEDKNKLINK
ncbi:MAG TPA: oligosaccharide flippase family protein, partial [Spirochaetota bacterium]|nr:oligosaccharide flippase family protein [Spirochaetota bacterium]